MQTVCPFVDDKTNESYLFANRLKQTKQTCPSMKTAICSFLTNYVVPRRSIPPQTDHATIRHTLSVHPMNPLLWQFTTVTFFHLYNSSTFFLSTLLKMLCDIMSTLSWSKIWTVCHKIFGPICDVLLAKCGCFVTGFLKTRLWCSVGFSVKCRCFVAWFLDICNVQVTVNKMWMFCHRIFLTHLWYPAGFSAVDVLSHDFFATFVMSKQ